MICPICYKSIANDHHYGNHLQCFESKYTYLKDFSSLRQKSSKSEDDQNSIKSTVGSSFYHGKFKKYAGKLREDNYILKFREEEHPELPYIEYTSNQIAEFIGLDVPQFGLIHINNNPIFITRNFMDFHSNAQLHHLYHYFKEDESFNLKVILGIIRDKTGNLNFIEKFIQCILYDSLVGNHDRHGRNIAFINMPGNKTILSPFYDNPSSIGIEHPDSLFFSLNPISRVGTSKNTQPSTTELIDEIITLGHRELFNNWINSIDIKAIQNIIQRSFASESRKEAFLKLVNSRYEEMTNRE